MDYVLQLPSRALDLFGDLLTCLNLKWKFLVWIMLLGPHCPKNFPWFLYSLARSTSALGHLLQVSLACRLCQGAHTEEYESPFRDHRLRMTYFRLSAIVQVVQNTTHLNAQGVRSQLLLISPCSACAPRPSMAFKPSTGTCNSFLYLAG